MRTLLCVCGRSCAGLRGLQTHGAKCPWELKRSAAFVAAIENGTDAVAASRAVEREAVAARS